ncbi:MAG TPA: LacI family DNA-binding transcriptional regulator [Candidatus Limnocylindrales bacterium]
MAAAAHVSTATAARALGDYGSVSAEVRERVIKAAATLGYRRNSIARSMITGTTHTIGLVVADIENPFFARAARGVADVARAAGYEVLLVNSDEDPAIERAAVQTLFEKRVDGLILAPASTGERPHLHELPEHGTPIVLIDRALPDSLVDAVVVDNQVAGRRAIEHLTGLGHRRIALITSQGLIHTNQSRLAGYLEGLAGAGIPIDDELVRMSPYRREDAALETEVVLGLPDPATAIFTTDNLMSLGAFEGIQRAGRRVPEEVSIVGFDDLEWTTIVRPQMTVVVQPVYELGATAARRLLARIRGDESPPELQVLETSFIVRASTGPPPVSTPR